MKTYSALIALCLVVGLSSCQQNPPKEGQRPNVVLIIADDWGVPQVGAYGSDFYKTPHIDRLVAEGMMFTAAYSSAAICSPTRAAIFTGKYPARLHITDFIAGNPNDTFPLSQPDWQRFLPLEETTAGEVFRAQGYATALFGKWHLSKEKMPPLSLEHNPDRQGFDESFLTYKPDPHLPIGPWQVPEGDPHNADTITTLALDFMERHRDKPFFLVVSHDGIHDPLMENQARIKPYADHPKAALPENNPTLAAMVERVDLNVGRVMERLEQLGIADNTLLVFCSDNGGLEKSAKQSPFRKGKAWLYEGGIRVPLVIRFPGKIQPRSTNAVPTASMDLLPTILGLTGTASPFSGDGLDLFGKSAIPENRPLFWNYPHYHTAGMRPAAAVRAGDFKLIEWYEPKLLGKPGAYELFDLKADPSETTDLSGSMPEKVEELRQMLDHWKKEVGAQEPTLNHQRL